MSLYSYIPAYDKLSDIYLQIMLHPPVVFMIY